ncbi:MAG: hypothetical protein IJY22_07080 [Clostridia bacterium]|nr:hypothetical protein [Clostridia bacterium]
MSEEKKSSGHFRINVFDVILILLAILCIVGIWQRQNIRRLLEEEQAADAYTVSFEIDCLRDTSLQYLTAGTVLYVKEGDARVILGTIAGEVAVVDASTEKMYITEDGETIYVDAYYPEDYSAVKAVLNCQGLHHNGGFLAGGSYPLSVNQSVTVYTENADFQICITSITKVG